MVSAAQIAHAFRAACRAELQALKPGNVHVHAGGHAMTVADFERSADAAAEPIARPGGTVGARILAAVEATRAVVDQNTNLGIVLLAAPLAHAAHAARGDDLRAALDQILAALDVDDAVQAYRAIRLAEPGGMGRVAEHDVTETPRVTLRQAMAAAAARDRIAWQYTHGFADIFERGLDRLRDGGARWDAMPWAVSAVYLGFVADAPDSLVARKFGDAAAQELRSTAADLLERLYAAARPEDLRSDLLAWDATLKAQSLNPGTSADLTVATLFVQALEQAQNPVS